MHSVCSFAYTDLSDTVIAFIASANLNLRPSIPTHSSVNNLQSITTILESSHKDPVKIPSRSRLKLGWIVKEPVPMKNPSTTNPPYIPNPHHLPLPLPSPPPAPFIPRISLENEWDGLSNNKDLPPAPSPMGHGGWGGWFKGQVQCCHVSGGCAPAPYLILRGSRLGCLLLYREGGGGWRRVEEGEQGTPD